MVKLILARPVHLVPQVALALMVVDPVVDRAPGPEVVAGNVIA
jgi:hypothetical protein